MEYVMPFELNISECLTDRTQKKVIARTLQNLKEYFGDSDAVNRILELENPVIYEYWESDNQFSEGDLSFGYTKIYPGTIGDEFYMTKGHFHVDNSPEIYYTLSGKGKLILMNREGVVEARDMVPGMLSYIPAQWAHRTANTGSEPFIFIGVWPGNIVHDYETTLKDGFASILKTKDGISLEIQNINSKSL